jgi:hypothetical protein
MVNRQGVTPIHRRGLEPPERRTAALQAATSVFKATISTPSTAWGLALGRRGTSIPSSAARWIKASSWRSKIKVRLVDLGGTVLGGSPADFGKLIVDETEKWSKVIRAANIKPE